MMSSLQRVFRQLPQVSGALMLAMLVDPTWAATEPGRVAFVDPAAPEVAGIRATAEAAAGIVGKKLLAALNAALAAGGPETAVVACQLQALPLTSEKIPGQPGVVGVKRTSLQLRNPANAPDPAERMALEHVARIVGRGEPPPPVLVQRIAPAGSTAPEWRVYRPMMVQPTCLLCHGDPAAQPPALRAALRQRYPADAATGYAVDSWRGLFSVTVSVPSSPPREQAPR